ncbi:MAG: hypothetical protein J1F12_00530 [Muribaculaceae bacterium]|nr:hypothetical protein [Muribaculaceae bacterium]
MKEIKEKEKTAQEIISPGKGFKGYTIEEIRFQRALVSMEAEFSKAKALKSWGNIQALNPFMPGPNKSSLPGKAGTVALKLINGLNYLDYALLGLSAFKGAKKIYSFFRGKKK